MAGPEDRQQETFGDLAEAFVRAPGPATLERLQAAILRAPGFDPLVSVGAILATARTPRAVLDELGARMPGLLLSPSAHAAQARAFAELGEEGPAGIERRMAQLALEAVRGSGEGTEQSPYRVLRLEDEYDLLAAEGRRSTGQTEHSDDRRVLDEHSLADDGRMWFELLWRSPTDLSGRSLSG
ncbi:hypothetical protein ACT3SP_08215 [Brachybacterium sp. AOP43-C2-M15]|uniref:hypothetical protein n=1 Tax=Brachybacterium sp. AOP43-C2-M15 TaxID=3457661 RepID=UPI004034CA7C